MSGSIWQATTGAREQRIDRRRRDGVELRSGQTPYPQDALDRWSKAGVLPIATRLGPPATGPPDSG